MARVVIVEGPDGAGKTSLADALMNDHRYAKVHLGPPEPGENVLEKYGHLLFEAVRSGENVVFDRLHLGELVYGPIMRQRDLLTRDGLKLMNRIIRAYDVKVLVALPPYRVCYENWCARKGSEYVGDKTRFAKIWEAYNAMKKDAVVNAVPVNYWDYTEVSATLAAQTLNSGLTVPMLKLPHGIIGSPKARTLFVGEIANQSKLDLPFFSLQGSSPWFNEALVEAGWDESEIALVNAFKLDKSPNDLVDMITSMPQAPELIALGRRAAQQVRKIVGGLFHELPHPQYWKRFHNPLTYQYVTWLKEIRTRRYANRREWLKVS